MTQTDVETALAAGHVWARMTHGAYWRCRRNGATRTWKTRPEDWSIPFKVGFREYGKINHDSLVARVGDVGWCNAHFVIADHDPRAA